MVKCSDKNHTHIPLLIPMDATSLHLDGNRLHYIDQQNFLGRQRVQKLYLNSSGVVRLSEAAFTGLADLRVLHLQDNKLSELKGYELTGLVHLRELYLENNALTYINEMTFEPLLSLQTLRLDGNMLTNFHVWKLNNNNLLMSVTLSENMWTCGCDFIPRFNEFLEKRKEVIADYERINCVSNNVIREGVREREPCSSKQATTTVTIKEKETESQVDLSLATILIPASLASLILVIGFLVVCVFRKSINTWLYSKSSEIYESNNSRAQASVYNNSQDSDYTSSKLFDVYVSYSVQDSEFVHNSLSQVLEQGSSKVCLHHRDFPHGAPLQETVSLIVDCSDRVAIVLTDSYLMTEWPVVKNSLFGHDSINQDMILFLLVQDIGNNVLYRHTDLCHWLSTCPIIKWGSAGFVNHLRYFLPPSPQLTLQRNIALTSQFPILEVPKNKTQITDQNIAAISHPNMVTIQSYQMAPKAQQSYQIAPESHTYQVLDPRIMLKNIDNGQLTTRKNPCLVLRVEATPNSSSPKIPSICHSYTHSTSSGHQLLAATEAEEYLV